MVWPLVSLLPLFQQQMMFRVGNVQSIYSFSEDRYLCFEVLERSKMYSEAKIFAF